ncbi:hypothetical protein J6590_022562 [Homalodisca vitripennis]|nr:hypothetical protein J6590_022562 [Homalodisca vitripennis]
MDEPVIGRVPHPHPTVMALVGGSPQIGLFVHHINPSERKQLLWQRFPFLCLRPFTPVILYCDLRGGSHKRVGRVCFLGGIGLGKYAGGARQWLGRVDVNIITSEPCDVTVASLTRRFFRQSGYIRSRCLRTANLIGGLGGHSYCQVTPPPPP